MNRETRLIDTPLFSLLVNVLSYYPCPSDCLSICCKLMNIDMDKHDFQILNKAGNIKIEKVELIKQDGTLYYSIQPPCQFLADINKCSAYNRRPTICRMFPFFFPSVEAAVSIYPCKLGMNILNEFFKFRKEKFGLDTPPELIDDLNKSNEIFYSNLDKNIDIPLPGITLRNLALFKEYLVSSSS
jgi:Fe-S-cluster containining protein